MQVEGDDDARTIINMHSLSLVSIKPERYINCSRLTYVGPFQCGYSVVDCSKFKKYKL